MRLLRSLNVPYPKQAKRSLGFRHEYENWKELRRSSTIYPKPLHIIFKITFFPQLMNLFLKRFVSVMFLLILDVINQNIFFLQGISQRTIFNSPTFKIRKKP